MSPKIFGLPDDRPCFSIAKSVVRTETYGEEDGEIILQFKVEYEHWCQPKKEEFGPMFNEGLNERENTNEPERVYPWVEGFSSLEEMGLREDEDADWIPAPEEVAIDPNRPIGKRILGVERRSIRLAKVLNDAEVQRIYEKQREVEQALVRLGKGKDIELLLEFLASVLAKFWIWYDANGLSFPEPARSSPEPEPRTRGKAFHTSDSPASHLMTTTDFSELELAKCLASTQSRMEYIGKLRAKGGTWEDTFDKLDSVYKRLGIAPHFKNPDSLKRSYNRYEVRRRKSGNNVPGE